jgi:2-aminoadipate transaminase
MSGTDSWAFRASSSSCLEGMTMGDVSFLYINHIRAGLPAPALPAPKPRFNFGAGHNDPELVPAEELAMASAEAVRAAGPKMALYFLGDSPLGTTELRTFVAEKMNRDRGTAITIDNVLITGGSAQGIDLINQLFVGPGETVIVEEFTYSGAFGKLNRIGAKYSGVALDDDGIIPGALDQLATDLKHKGTPAKYLYSIPTVQNPTGTVMSIERRKQVLAVAARHRLPILEDECYADVVWKTELPPSLYALAPEQVVHIGSFSKSLAPALRVAYVVALPDVLAQLQACKNDGGTGAIDQLVVAKYFGAKFDAHLAWVAAILEEKLGVMMDAITREFGTSAEFSKPKGGIFLWLKLPAHVDTRSFAAAAQAAGVTYNPGPEWAADPEASKHYLRLCFAMPTKDEIRQGIAELARICFEATGVPERGQSVARVQS